MINRKITSLLIALAIISTSAVTTGCGAGGSEFDDGVIRDDMTAMEIADEMGVGINLGNTFDAFWEDLSNKTSGAQTIGNDTPVDYEKCWGAIETTEECIAGMAEAGFNTVRIPVYWGNMMEDDGKYEIDENYIARIREVVDWCRKNDLYVVINMHHYDAFLIENLEKEEVLKATETVWKQIAKEFKGYSDYLIFEGFNEALGTVPEGEEFSEEEIYDYVNDMNSTFVNTVRKTGGNNKERILIASGYWTNIDNTTKDSFVMPEDSIEDRMMVSVHYIDNACYWTNRIGGDYWLKYSTDQCDLLKAAFTEKNIPVFVGETTGMYPAENFDSSVKVTNSSECLSTILNMAVDYDFVPVLWDVNDGFYSRSEGKIKSETDAEVIKNISYRIENEK